MSRKGTKVKSERKLSREVKLEEGTLACGCEYMIKRAIFSDGSCVYGVQIFAIETVIRPNGDESFCALARDFDTRRLALAGLESCDAELHGLMDQGRLLAAGVEPGGYALLTEQNHHDGSVMHAFGLPPDCAPGRLN